MSASLPLSRQGIVCSSASQPKNAVNHSDHLVFRKDKSTKFDRVGKLYTGTSSTKTKTTAKITYCNKKGVTSSLIAIILTVVVIGIIFILAPTLISGDRCNWGDAEFCRSSVIVATKTGLFTTETLQTNLGCETCFPKIEDMEEKEQAVNEIAEQVARCWWQFGEGKYHPFRGEVGLEKPAHCFVCSKFTLNPKLNGMDLMHQITSEDIIKEMKQQRVPTEQRTLYQATQKGIPVIYGKEAVLLTTPKIASMDWIVDNFMPDHTGGIVRWLWDVDSTSQLAALAYSNSQKNENDYAIVYYQIADQYWRELAEAIELEIPAINDAPSQVFIAPFNNLGSQDLGCEVLQG